MTMHKPMVLAVLATVLIALAVAPTATATKPLREIKPAQDDVLITDQCAFPVLAHFDGPEIDTTFFDKAGNPFRLLGVFPGHTLTLTNPETGKSITVGATGSFQLKLEPDGSGSAMVTGQGAWPGNPITGEPGIWYQSGRVSTSWDAEGNTTSLESSGTLVDLCPQLSPQHALSPRAVEVCQQCAVACPSGSPQGRCRVRRRLRERQQRACITGALRARGQRARHTAWFAVRLGDSQFAILSGGGAALESIQPSPALKRA